MVKHKTKETRTGFEHKHLRTSLSIQSLFHSSLLLIYSQVESQNPVENTFNSE